MVVLCDLDIPGLRVTYLCIYMVSNVHVCVHVSVAGSRGCSIPVDLARNTMRGLHTHHKQGSYTNSEKASLHRDSIMYFDSLI